MGRTILSLSFGTRSLPELLAAVFTTLQIAFAATFMSAVASSFVGPLAARNVASNSPTRSAFRGVALFLRAVPDLVVAIVFIIATGFGPQAGALALGIGGIGLLGKLVADSMEEVPRGPELALAATGASRVQVFFAATVPLSAPSLVRHLMYLLEQNVRAATLLGVVGAGGIGFLLINALQGANFNEVLTYLIVIIAMVASVESVSVALRHTRWHDGNPGITRAAVSRKTRPQNCPVKGPYSVHC